MRYHAIKIAARNLSFFVVLDQLGLHVTEGTGKKNNGIDAFLYIEQTVSLSNSFRLLHVYGVSGITTSVLKLLLVDDHPSVLEGTKLMIQRYGEIEVTVTTSGATALQLIQVQKFDVILFDFYMPDFNGVELTKRVLKMDSEAIILIYTGIDILPYFNLLVQSGVSGFVSKTATQEQLITAIQCALRGEAVIPVTWLKQLRRQSMGIIKDEEKVRDIMVSEKEQKILQELAKGKTNRDIAQILFMSQRTLEYRLTHLFRKFGVRSRMELVMKAKELGLIFEELIKEGAK